MRKLILACATVMLPGVLVGGCSSAEQRPSPAPTPAAATAVSTPYPWKTATPTATATPGITPAADQAAREALGAGRLFVYADEVGYEVHGDRHYPIVEVVSYDLDAHRVVGAFRVGGAGSYVYMHDIQLAGRRIVINMESRVVITELDGSGMRDLAVAAQDVMFPSAAVSHDGKRLAVGAEARDLNDISKAYLAFIDIESGRELRRVTSSTETAPFMPPAVIGWWEDGKAVEVTRIAHKGAPGATSTVFVDGTARPHEPSNRVGFDPGGRGAAFRVGDWIAWCDGGDGVMAPGFRLTDSATATTGATFKALRQAGMVWAWEPGGDGILFAMADLRPGGDAATDRPCAEWGGSARELTYVDNKGFLIRDPDHLLRRWAGERYVDVICPDGPVPAVDTVHGSWSCPATTDTPQAILVVEGRDVGEVTRGQLVGWLDPARR